MDKILYWRDANDSFSTGTEEDFLAMIKEDYSEEDFFSMIGDCYNWELPIIGKVDPETCLKALIPDRLEAMIEEERMYRAKEVEQLLEEVELWETYDTYGFDIFVVPRYIPKQDYPKFMEKLGNFLKDVKYPF